MKAEIAELRRRLVQVESALGLDHNNFIPPGGDQDAKDHGLADAVEEEALAIGAAQRRLGSSLLVETNLPSGVSHE